jgi:hypothetical protein
MSYERTKLTTTFISGKASVTLIIPIHLARQYGIDQPSHVVVEGTEEGILVRKAELKTGDIGSEKI